MSRRRGRRGGGPPHRQQQPVSNLGTLRVTAHQVQAAAEGVVVTDGKVELRGRLFRHAETLGAMPLLVFANISRDGVDANSMEGMAAIHDLLFDCIWQGNSVDWDGCDRPDCLPCNDDPRMPKLCDQYDPGEWPAFVKHSNRHKVEGDELMGVAKRVIESLARGRTGSPSGSASGSRPTLPSSTASSSPTAMGGMPEPPGGYIDVNDLV